MQTQGYGPSRQSVCACVYEHGDMTWACCIAHRANYEHDDVTVEPVGRCAYEFLTRAGGSRCNLLRHAQSLKSLTSAAAVSTSLCPDGISICRLSSQAAVRVARAVPATRWYGTAAAPTCIGFAGSSELRSLVQGKLYAQEICGLKSSFAPSHYVLLGV